MERIITIIGVTPQGKRFRPTNWHVRIAGSAAAFINGRILYHEYVTPYCIIHRNLSAVKIDSRLEETNKEIYDFILDFAKTNNMVIDYGVEQTEQTIQSTEESVGPAKKRHHSKV